LNHGTRAERGSILVVVFACKAEPLVKVGSAAASIVGLWCPRERGVMYDALLRLAGGGGRKSTLVVICRVRGGATRRAEPVVKPGERGRIDLCKRMTLMYV
jgi:hypothetical protein